MYNLKYNINQIVNKETGEKMAKFSIAFIAPADTDQLYHKIIDGDTRDAALRKFFNENISEFYSNDDQGFYYFKEDFFDETTASGSIIEL